MAEVLDILELGDEPPRPGPTVATPAPVDVDVSSEASDDELAPSRWRRWGGVVVVAVLALAVAYTVAEGGASQAPPARPSTIAIAPGAEVAARAALEEWARFATAGDVEALRDTFDPAGPQFAQLAGETHAAGGGQHYRFDATVGRTSAGSRPGEELVMADVVVARPGETDQHFAWELVMRQADDKVWRLWTVRDRAPAAASGGAP